MKRVIILKKEQGCILVCNQVNIIQLKTPKFEFGKQTQSRKNLQRKGIFAETDITIKNIETLRNNQETRQYTPRVLKDLKCAKKKGE